MTGDIGALTFIKMYDCNCISSQEDRLLIAEAHVNIHCGVQVSFGF